MTTMELLTWVRGTGMTIAIVLMIFGIVVRLLEMLILGRKKDLSVARDPSSAKYGWRTVLTRSMPSMACLKAVPVTFITGYIFHIGLFIIVLFYVPHILFIRDLVGIEWTGLPFWMIDGITLLTMLAMLVTLWYRAWDKVRRYISRFSDYFVWAVTFLPVLTGCLLYHRLGLAYNEMMIVHLVTVQLLLISLPMTKLMHTFTFVFSRWYSGEAAGRKGVKV